MSLNVMSINAWGGKEWHALGEYLVKSDCDVICLQEVFSAPFLASKTDWTSNNFELALFTQVARSLPDHIGFFSPTSDRMGINYLGEFVDNSTEVNQCSIGTAIFIRKGLKVDAVGDLFVYGNRNSRVNGISQYAPKALQYAVVVKDNRKYNIFNFHGLWNGGGKKDCPERLQQSINIKSFLENFNKRKILCGDFNLDPETESVKILENSGKMLNLISKFGITSTRTRLYRSHGTGSLYADYFFVSPDILVEDFKVDPAEVSDHSPLVLTCS